jgi:hypothetical protein
MRAVLKRRRTVYGVFRAQVLSCGFFRPVNVRLRRGDSRVDMRLHGCFGALDMRLQSCLRGYQIISRCPSDRCSRCLDGRNDARGVCLSRGVRLRLLT